MKTSGELLKIIIEEHIRILNSNLVGIYLHGSLAMDCFNREVSDIDFLVVLNKKISREIKTKLIQVLVDNEQYAPKKGYEMSVLLLKDTQKFRYPTPFLLHYSLGHREKFLKSGELCEDGIDPDLAAHITILKNRGKCLYGDKIENVFDNVPREDYIKSILYDIKDAREILETDTTYFILNLCRTLYYLREGYIGSKIEGAEWAMNKLPDKYIPVIQNTLNIYQKGEKRINWDIRLIEDFVEYMFSEIKRIIKIPLSIIPPL